MNYRSRWEDFDNEKIRENTTGNSTTILHVVKNMKSIGNVTFPS
jgi:hypothetical protein